MESTLKSFEEIHDAYAYFQAHSTEAHECTQALLSELLRIVPQNQSWTLADFGCGAGEFTDGLLKQCNFAPDLLSLILIEPDPSYRNTASQRLSGFTKNPIVTKPTLTTHDFPSPAADILLSNHVLYYVSDLNQTLNSLQAAIKPNGTLLISLANRTNALLQGWDFLFGLFGEKCPRPVLLALQSHLSPSSSDVPVRCRPGYRSGGRVLQQCQQSIFA